MNTNQDKGLDMAIGRLAGWVTLAATALLVACGSDDAATDAAQGGELVITASAEGLGANGYAFPPGPGQELAFVDGWQVRFDRILVVVGSVSLHDMPDKNPGNQGETGAEVERRIGPWVVDLAKPGNEADKGGAGKVAIRLPIQDLKGMFDLEQRYAFGFDLTAATSNATLVNVAADDADLQTMVSKGLRVLLVGTATLKASEAQCKASKDGFDWAALPTPVRFRFGLPGAVSYRNCQNPDNLGEPIASEEAQRGVQMLPNAPTFAQITIHTDHLFWNSTSHENVPMFNQFAAHAKQQNGEWVVELDDVASVPLSPVTSSSGAAIPWRSCVSDALYTLPTTPSEMTFDTGGQPLTNLRDFVSFNAATMGHLNADGLCYVEGLAH